MQTQKTFELVEALVSYVEHEIRDIPAGSRFALVSGPATETMTRTLTRKGYCVQSATSRSRQGLDLVVVMDAYEAMTPSVESAVLSLNHEGRLIAAEAELSHRQERRLRALGFLVRIKKLGPVELDGEMAGTASATSQSSLYIYDAILVRRRQSLR